MKKIIITVVGKDMVGIIAAICTNLASNDVNVLDISQTVLQDMFNMMMIVDISKSSKNFQELSDELTNIGKNMGVEVKMQREEIFDSMHRI